MCDASILPVAELDTQAAKAAACCIDGKFSFDAIPAHFLAISGFRYLVLCASSQVTMILGFGRQTTMPVPTPWICCNSLPVLHSDYSCWTRWVQSILVLEMMDGWLGASGHCLNHQGQGDKKPVWQINDFALLGARLIEHDILKWMGAKPQLVMFVEMRMCCHRHMYAFCVCVCVCVYAHEQMSRVIY